jgi:AraC-like DNA-binding protein
MDYKELQPSAALAPMVDRIWTLEGHAAELGEDGQPVLPDGHPEIVLHFGDAFERLDAEGRAERQPSILFAGQLNRQLQLRATGRVSVLGIRLRPFGGASLIGIPQHELAGLTVGIDLVSKSLSRALTDVYESAGRPDETLDLVQTRLARALDATGVDARIQYAVEAIERSYGRLSMDHLARTTGLTRRHLERRFLQMVGMTPKRLARIARFQRALHLLERFDAPGRGTHAAAACGYADQAHFIRDFRDLAGCPPGEHLLRRSELTGFFTR